MSKTKASTVLKGIWRWCIILFTLFIQVSFLAVCVYRVIPVKVTTFMIFKGNGFRSDWVRMEKISPNLPKAVITSEDPKFLNHFGFDFENIAQSIEDSQEDNKRLRGASTVSQQMTKNLFLWPDRTFIRKGIEAVLTIMVETFWNKKRILEVYLNIVEFGKGLYGVEAASQVYFKKHAAELTKDESIIMITALPNPLIYQIDKPSPKMKRKAAWIRRMWKYSENPPEWWFASPLTEDKK